MRTGKRPRLGRQIAVTLAVGGLAALLPVTSRTAQAAMPLFDFPCSSGGQITGDFNNDGRPDLAIAAPGDDLEQVEVDGSITRNVPDGGSVSIVYSDGSGLNPRLTISSQTRKFFSQNTPDMVETSEKEDHFGFALASGDFDGIGGDDLAVGVPGEGGVGAVHIIYSGGPNGSTGDTNDTIGLSTGVPGSTQFNEIFTQNTSGIDGTAEAGDAFGYALAAGDINADGFADLAIGVPREDLGRTADAGVVQIIYGSDRGLSAAAGPGDQIFEQGPGLIRSPEVGRAEPSDFFGASLAIGQFNNGSGLDLAVGAPGEDLKQVPDGGAVRILYSRGAFGLSTTESDFFHQQWPHVDGIGESGDRFACALAAGDFDFDGDDDLAIGAPGESLGADTNAGMLHVMYNSGNLTGITAEPGTVASNGWIPDQTFTEDDGGVPGVAKPNDRFGASLAVANFDGDGPDDIAIGLPTEKLFEEDNAGSVRVMYGSTGFGITDDNGAAFAQSGTPLPDMCPALGIVDDIATLEDIFKRITDKCLIGPPDYSPILMVEETGDQLGASIAAADFDGDGHGDLVAGAPGEDLGLFVNWLSEEEIVVSDELLVNLGIPVPLDADEVNDAGALNVVYGPFPRPVDSPDRMDLLYRTGDSDLNPVRSFIHDEFGDILQNNQIAEPGEEGLTPADPSYSAVLDGDRLGAEQS